MKSLENDNNWLGFSLSPHTNNMEGSVEHDQAQACSNGVSNATPVSFSHHYPQFNYYPGIFYGVEAENAASYYSSLSVMPLKSDGSLCIMEAMNRSQPQGIVSSTMGTHHYDRREMALSLDSMYYNQNQDQNESNGQDLLNNLQESSENQQQQIQVQEYQNYSGFRGYELYQASQLETKESKLPDCNLQLQEPKMVGCVGENRNMTAMGYGDLQTLSLSTSPGSQSSCVTASQQISPTVTECNVAMDTKKRCPGKADSKKIVHRKSINTFGQRTSQYRGVTRHRWTGRYEAHLWDNSCKKEGQARKGKQVYLGGYDLEEKAARSYDLAALKYWGPSTHINFSLENYQQELEEMKNMTRQEYVAHLRRRSSGFSRGASMYRGVTRHHQHGRWQARIGRVAGNKDLYLGTFSTQEEAAEAYDIAAIKFRGLNAVTNFVNSKYDVEKIMASSTLLTGESARRNQDRELTIPTSSDNLLNANDNESLKMVTHFSNASSLATSLSSSREPSPDKNQLPTNTWIQSAHLRPQIPFFAAWTDASQF